MIDKLEGLRARTATSWEATVDTADSRRVAAAEHDRDDALAYWTAALACFEEDDVSGARAALESARQLASDWGDDAPEREAIALLAACDRTMIGTRPGARPGETVLTVAGAEYQHTWSSNAGDAFTAPDGETYGSMAALAERCGWSLDVYDAACDALARRLTRGAS